MSPYKVLSNVIYVTLLDLLDQILVILHVLLIYDDNLALLCVLSLSVIRWYFFHLNCMVIIWQVATIHVNNQFWWVLLHWVIEVVKPVIVSKIYQSLSSPRGSKVLIYLVLLNGVLNHRVKFFLRFGGASKKLSKSVLSSKICPESFMDVGVLVSSSTSKISLIHGAMMSMHDLRRPSLAI